MAFCLFGITAHILLHDQIYYEKSLQLRFEPSAVYLSVSTKNGVTVVQGCAISCTYTCAYDCGAGVCLSPQSAGRRRKRADSSSPPAPDDLASLPSSRSKRQAPSTAAATQMRTYGAVLRSVFIFHLDFSNSKICCHCVLFRVRNRLDLFRNSFACFSMHYVSLFCFVSPTLSFAVVLFLLCFATKLPSTAAGY